MAEGDFSIERFCIAWGHALSSHFGVDIEVTARLKDEYKKEGEKIERDYQHQGD